MTTSKEWQLVIASADDGSRREHITHLAEPRFTARVVQIEPFEDLPLEIEGNVDVVSGYRFQIDPRTLLCEIDWIDEVPNGHHGPWLSKATSARNRLRGHFMHWIALPPVMDMASRIRLDISGCRCWGDYTEVFCKENDRTNGELVRRARSMVGVLSTGEVPVLLGMLHAADYSRVADEIAGDDNWRRLDRTSGQNAEATALPIMRQ